MAEREREINAYRQIALKYRAAAKASDQRLRRLHVQLRDREDRADNLLQLSVREKISDLRSRVSATRAQHLSLQDACIVSMGPHYIRPEQHEMYVSKSRDLERLLRSQIIGLESQATALDYSRRHFCILKRQEIKSESMNGMRLECMWMNIAERLEEAEKINRNLEAEAQSLETVIGRVQDRAWFNHFIRSSYN